MQRLGWYIEGLHGYFLFAAALNFTHETYRTAVRLCTYDALWFATVFIIFALE